MQFHSGAVCANLRGLVFVVRLSQVTAGYIKPKCKCLLLPWFEVKTATLSHRGQLCNFISCLCVRVFHLPYYAFPVSSTIQRVPHWLSGKERLKYASGPWHLVTFRFLPHIRIFTVSGSSAPWNTELGWLILRCFHRDFTGLPTWWSLQFGARQQSAMFRYISSFYECVCVCMWKWKFLPRDPLAV